MRAHQFTSFLPNTAILTAGVVFLAGCSGATGVGSIFVKSESVPATQGATITVSSAESASLAGASLQISPRSISSDATLHISLGKEDLAGTDEQAAGPVAEWTPATLAFSTPALMTLPVSLPNGGGGIRALEVELSSSSGERSSALPFNVTVSGDATLIQFYVSSLGSFQPVVAKACTSSRTCHDGRVCIDGFCRRPAALDGGYRGYDGGTWFPDGGFTPPDGGYFPWDGGTPDGGYFPWDGGVQDAGWPVYDGGIWTGDGGFVADGG